MLRLLENVLRKIHQFRSPSQPGTLKYAPILIPRTCFERFSYIYRYTHFIMAAVLIEKIIGKCSLFVHMRNTSEVCQILVFEATGSILGKIVLKFSSLVHGHL